MDSLKAPCRECQCYNLSTSCATPTGICIGCTGNSEGDNCERCIPGYYGNPVEAVPCVPCVCNGRSGTCDMNGICDNCSTGYRGDYCELCDNGYYVRKILNVQD